MRIRALRKEIDVLLRDEDLDGALARLRRYPVDRVLKALFSCLCHCEPLVKWHAVTAMGQVVAGLADRDMEASRVVMRRFMWMLNDESGGIGWGVPEAFGEVTACHGGLAAEYAHILVSFMREDGFYLELEALQQGLMWGLARLGEVRPQLLAEKDAVRYLLPYLDSADMVVRGLAALALGNIGPATLVDALRPLEGVRKKLPVYRDRQLVECTVGQLAREAMARLRKR